MAVAWPGLSALEPPSGTYLHRSNLAMNNGAQEYLVKSHISGENLDAAIQKAIFAVAFKNAHSLIKIFFATSSVIPPK